MYFQETKEQNIYKTAFFPSRDEARPFAGAFEVRNNLSTPEKSVPKCRSGLWKNWPRLTKRDSIDAGTQIVHSSFCFPAGKESLA